MITYGLKSRRKFYVDFRLYAKQSNPTKCCRSTPLDVHDVHPKINQQQKIKCLIIHSYQKDNFGSSQLR
ncbi:hypothetical protein BpHYR1_015788 [Brachionus plicatilis]|uniref:Uncharacterized protein n=1 Tax=Brachionus plicatilis TaxID=10195 RepID=A0A3M7T3J0_BRAPC|nr:hypothetical protein BpHYR1_015788 [Brachionus plicatilis]